MEFIYASPILALVNNGLKYCINRLQLNLRYKITEQLTTKYTQGFVCCHFTHFYSHYIIITISYIVEDLLLT